VLIALGFFFGSNLSKTQSDARQQSVVERLINPQPPAPVAPAVVVSWWSLMTPTEQTAIRDSSNSGNTKSQEVFAALQAGKATKEDLDYLVAVSLLTKDRVDILTSASPPLK